MTTIVSVRRGRQVALGGDGQVTLGAVVAKSSARKVRRLYHEKYWLDLRVELPMPLRCSSASKINWKHIKATSCALPWN